ncbi:MAG: ParA family partition ATPase [Dongiaceae bacterium]
MAGHPITITVAQQKGGSGKTTVALQLAAAWDKQGYKVGIIDIDPQGSAGAWAHKRAQEMGENYTGPEVISITGWRMVGELSRLKNSFDIIVVDTPPRAESEVRIAVRSSDLVVIPLQPSPMDVWATRPTLEFCLREKVLPFLVFNRYSDRTNLAQEMKEAAYDLGAEIANTTLGSRVGLAASLAAGKSIVEMAASSPAAEEIEALAKEVLKKVNQIKNKSSSGYRRAA